MLKRWFPWRFLVKRAASAYGIADPLTLIARLRRFAQPSEIQEPIELLRAGIIFHARGLINTRAIQHNLDWVWPFWVEKQFNPADPSFIPRAFSFSHVNLTHRNWTAVGRPDAPVYPIVDPRGLVTPKYDGWSLDFWLVMEDGQRLLPSKLARVDQRWVLSNELTVETRCRQGGLELSSRAWVTCDGASPQLRLEASATADGVGHLVVSVRPYNAEGVQFVEHMAYDAAAKSLTVDGGTRLEFGSAPENVSFSTYKRGDVLHSIGVPDGETSVSCDVGMATAAVLFPLDREGKREIEMGVDLSSDLEGHAVGGCDPSKTWDMTLAGTAKLQIPDQRIRFLYDAAVRTLTLLSAGDVFPGPYTYKRFWFRDACLMLHAMLSVGLTDRCARIIGSFPSRQKRSGYFRSQEGEWDSNGQVLWIIERFLQMTGRRLPAEWHASVWKGADWITRKRGSQGSGAPHAGLLPPGFSAEHFGPNDYYYWDDFWGVAGLRAAADLARRAGERGRAERYDCEAAEFEQAIRRSIASIPAQRSQGAIPASPYRRMDAGAIGSLVADYPLQLLPADDARIGKTADYLLEHCFVSGAFFQDMIHSGLNPYLTLAVAQTLLRREDGRYRDLVLRVAELASSTGQWPEALHPFTEGGCMGDGQHGWAAAEWVMIVRNMFVREERAGLVVGAGLCREWLSSRDRLSFGPTPTAWGDVSVSVLKRGRDRLLDVEGQWRGDLPAVHARIPGFAPLEIDPRGSPMRLEPVS